MYTYHTNRYYRHYVECRSEDYVYLYYVVPSMVIPFVVPTKIPHILVDLTVLIIKNGPVYLFYITIKVGK